MKEKGRPVPARPQAGARAGGGEERASETLAEALHRLGRAGFVRRFERAGDTLRCASCEVTFPPEELVVEEVVEVADEGTGVRRMLYALRCTSCGANGTWTVTGAEPADIDLLHRLGTSTPLAAPAPLPTGPPD